MKKGITIFCLVLFLFMIPFFLLSGSKERELELTRSEELRREIRLINLLNGLELTPGQMKVILRNAEGAQKLRYEFQTILYFREKEIESMLEEIKSYLQENREVPPATAQKFHRLDTELKKERLRIYKKVEEMTREIKEMLSEHQLYQLREFIPCIIPPKGEPRIGQASDYTGVVKNMEKLRNIPNRVYEWKKDEIISRTLERMRLNVPPRVEIDEEEMREHIRSVFERVRYLKEAEFEIQKQSLAEELVSPIKPQAFLNNLDRKIEAFLLSPDIISLLEERIQKLD